MALVIAVIVGYLLGSIPFGFLMGRWMGIDLRAAGSGNIGATNALRILGKPAGIAVLALDAIKGASACWLSPVVAGLLVDVVPTGSLVMVTGGFAAVLGHNYTCWLRFKGGKGIATSAGVLLALTPGGLAASLSTFLILLALTRTVSIGSIGAAIVMPIGTWLSGGSGVLIGVTVVMGVLAIYKHRANIERLIAGTEPRVGNKKTGES